MHKTYQVEHDFLKARNLMNTPRDTLDGSTAISKNRIRVLPLVRPAAAAAEHTKHASAKHPNPHEPKPLPY